MTKDSPPHLQRLVGSWATEATHPAMPGVVVHGTAVFEWLEGEQFLIQRSRNDHPDFPDAIAIIGDTDADRAEDVGNGAAADSDAPLTLHYFDSRGVFRVYQTTVDEQAWRWWRDVPGFSQRMTFTFADDGNTIVGTSQLCRDDINWDDDLESTYRRQR